MRQSPSHFNLTFDVLRDSVGIRELPQVFLGLSHGHVLAVVNAERRGDSPHDVCNFR
jgi:hypothetical protein